MGSEFDRLELALGMLRDGTISLDEQGRVWRHFEMACVRGEGFVRRAVEPPRRADWRVNKQCLYRRFVFRPPGFPRVTCRVLVHVLVWTWHKGPVPAGLQVNHKDLNPENNRLDNLELMTGEQNVRHYWLTATSWRGRPRKTPEQIAGIVSLAALGFSREEIAVRSGTPVGSIAYYLRVGRKHEND